MMKFEKRWICLTASWLLVTAALNAQPLWAQQSWGTLKGRIVYDGVIPEVIALDITRDEEYCGKAGLVDESLVVNPEDRGIRYVAIWLDSREPVAVHPDRQAFAEKSPTIDNKNCRFEPRMLALRVKETLVISNSDSVAHNAAVFARRNQPFSEIIPSNQPLTKTMAKAELLPIRVDCSIHSWMKSWIVITDHPYVGITDEHGYFEIPQVPAGEWKFRFWHERPGHIKSLEQDSKVAPIEKGVWMLKIEGDKTLDLGELKASASQFNASK